MGKECRGLSVPNADHIKAQEMGFWVKANARGTEWDSVFVCVVLWVGGTRRWCCFGTDTAEQEVIWRGDVSREIDEQGSDTKCPRPVCERVCVCVCVCLAGLESFSTQNTKSLTFTFMILEGAFSQKLSQNCAYRELRTICVHRSGDFRHNFPLSCFNFHLITHSLNLQKAQMAGAESAAVFLCFWSLQSNFICWSICGTRFIFCFQFPIHTWPRSSPTALWFLWICLNVQ